MATITSLDALVGAHPDALADFFAGGRPCDPSRVTTNRGLLLALQPLAPAHALLGPLVAGVARRFVPWGGKTFESGGTAGANVVFGRKVLRFHGEVVPSALDGRPTLALRYDGLRNPWPAAHLQDELREVGPGVVLGPLLWRSADGAATPLLWWGLTPGG
ncbi:MAG: hypothetical protein FJ096_15040 [Deltaproteobacteria bacterium]|nr:hypothetical protein [Deltaproteobacteria bacterium]